MTFEVELLESSNSILISKLWTGPQALSRGFEPCVRLSIDINIIAHLTLKVGSNPLHVSPYFTLYLAEIGEMFGLALRRALSILIAYFI